MYLKRFLLFLGRYLSWVSYTTTKMPPMLSATRAWHNAHTQACSCGFSSGDNHFVLKPRRRAGHARSRPGACAPLWPAQAHAASQTPKPLSSRAAPGHMAQQQLPLWLLSGEAAQGRGLAASSSSLAPFLQPNTIWPPCQPQGPPALYVTLPDGTLAQVLQAPFRAESLSVARTIDANTLQQSFGPSMFAAGAQAQAAQDRSSSSSAQIASSSGAVDSRVCHTNGCTA